MDLVPFGGQLPSRFQIGDDVFFNSSRQRVSGVVFRPGQICYILSPCGREVLSHEVRGIDLFEVKTLGS